ncbi:tetratricopeptide repeat protein [bacterium]|nr:tetratricopeptide repeat protein [bacterium]
MEQVYRQQKNLLKEESLYKKAIAVFPDMEGEYLYKLADVYERAGEFEKALELLEEIGKKFPSDAVSARAQLTSAWIYCHRFGEYKRAARIYKKLAKKNVLPWLKSSALLGAAETYEFAHKYKRALRGYSKVVKKFPLTPAAYDAGLRVDAIQNGNDCGGEALKLFTLNYRYWRAKKFNESIAVCRKIVSEYPDSYLAASAQYYKGFMLQFDLEDYENAIIEYQKVLKNYPASGRASFALYRIGECYKNQGKFIMTNEINMRVLREYPGSLPTRWIK